MTNRMLCHKRFNLPLSQRFTCTDNEYYVKLRTAYCIRCIRPATPPAPEQTLEYGCSTAEFEGLPSARARGSRSMARCSYSRLQLDDLRVGGDDASDESMMHQMRLSKVVSRRL